MLKQLGVILSTIASVLLIFVLLFTAVEISISDTTFISNEYAKLLRTEEIKMENIVRSADVGTGISSQDLTDSCMRLIDYMKGEAPSIDILVTINGKKTLMFDNEQEVVHMKDCQVLYLTLKRYRDISVIAALVLYLLSAIVSFKNGPLHSIGKGYICGSFVSALALGFIGTWAALDFSSFWTFFHQAAFYNDIKKNYSFDPRTSRMINLLPETFFKDIVIKIVLLAAIAFIFLLILAIVIVVAYNRKRRREEEAAELRAEQRRARRKQKKAAEQEVSVPVIAPAEEIPEETSTNSPETAAVEEDTPVSAEAEAETEDNSVSK